MRTRDRIATILAIFTVLTVQAAQAGPPPAAPPQVENGARARFSMLFPAPSELAARLRSTGIQVKPLAALHEQVPAPAWSALTARQRELQLGSVLGYLGVAVATMDTAAMGACLTQIVAGSEAMGIDRKSKAYQSAKRMKDDLRKGKTSEAKLLGVLDEMRRDTLRELSTRADAAVVLAAAWLRGSALLTKDLASEAQALKIAEFVLRPELINFIAGLSDTGAAIDVPAEARKLAAIAKKKQIGRDDLRSFELFANAILQTTQVKP